MVLSLCHPQPCHKSRQGTALKCRHSLQTAESSASPPAFWIPGDYFYPWSTHISDILVAGESSSSPIVFVLTCLCLQVATDCWNLLRDILMREGSLPFVSANYADIPLLARHLVSLDSILATLAGAGWPIVCEAEEPRCLLFIISLESI